jgi:hypothetical protein
MGPIKHTHCKEGTKETNHLQRWDHKNTPAAEKEPKKHTNCNEWTEETHQLLRRNQGNTPSAMKEP